MESLNITKASGKKVNWKAHSTRLAGGRQERLRKEWGRFLSHKKRIRPPCRSIDRINVFPAEAILENVSIFVLVVVKVFERGGRPKSERTETEQSGQIRFSNLNTDFVPPLVNHLGDKFVNHLSGNAVPLKLGSDGNVRDEKTIFRRFVNDKTDDALLVFGDHSETVRLLKTLQKLLVCPGKLKTCFLNRQYFGKIPTNHPPNVNLNFLTLKKIHSCTSMLFS